MGIEEALKENLLPNSEDCGYSATRTMLFL